MTRLIAFALIGALVGFVGSTTSESAVQDDDVTAPIPPEDVPSPAMKKAMNAVIDVELVNLPLGEALLQLSRRHGVDISFYDGYSAKEIEAYRNRTVTFSAKRTNLFAALQSIARELDLAVVNDSRSFVIYERNDSSARPRFVKFHPVADLVVHHTGGWIDPYAETVIQLIQDTVDRDIWEPNGGDCTIQFYRTTITLVVHCPRDTHEKVNRLLDLLRKTRERTIQLLERHNLPALEDILVQQDRAVGSPLGFYSPPQYPSASEIHGALSRLSTVDSAQNNLSSKVSELEREIQSLKTRLDPKPPQELKPIPSKPGEPPSPKKKKATTDDPDF